MQSKILNIGMQLQLFLDDWLIETMKDLALKLHNPQPQEVAIWSDKPYETPTLYDPVVIKDGDLYRMWYRTNFDAPPYYTGYAESLDGIRWTKPSLHLIEYGGSTDNNLLWQSGQNEGYVLSIFKDGNPNAHETERYKAIAVSKRGVRSSRRMEYIGRICKKQRTPSAYRNQNPSSLDPKVTPLLIHTISPSGTQHTAVTSPTYAGGEAASVGFAAGFPPIFVTGPN